MDKKYRCNTQIKWSYSYLFRRSRNKALKQEKFPIPTLDSLIDNMSGAKYF